MSDKLIKAIDKSGKLRLITMEATDLVKEAKTRHDTWKTSTNILGQTLIGSTLLAAALLKDKDELTIRLLDSGAAGATIVTAKANLKVKGYIQKHHTVDDESIAGQGLLEVTKDQGLETPYTGQVPIVSEKISEDFAYYLAKSEQINSAMGLSVLLSDNNDVNAAGGFLLQALPGASGKQIKEVEQRIDRLGKLSNQFLTEDASEKLIEKILGMNAKILAKEKPQFACDCSKDKYSKILATLDRKSLTDMIRLDHGAELTCNFCGDKYNFDEDELKLIRDGKK